jgi:predicted DNA-binding transcriptional regulator AlpA
MEGDWLDMAALTRGTGLSENTIRRLIQAGRFPEPCEITEKIRLWPKDDLLWWRLTVERGPRLRGSEAPEEEKDSEVLGATRPQALPHAAKRAKPGNDA